MGELIGPSPAATPPRVRRVPVQLGCCARSTAPEAALPCAVCAPVQPPSLEVIEAHLVATRERYPEAPMMVSFFGGAPPEDEALALVTQHDLPFGARIRPDLLSRAALQRLLQAGVRWIELDLLTLDDAVLKAVGRRYRSKRLLQMFDGLQEAHRTHGVEIGAVLAPGLPGSHHAGSVADATALAGRLHTARLHPVQVLRGARLWESHASGRYKPMLLSQAITTCAAMAEVLESAGTRVIRIGQQAKADGLGEATAGPRHSGLGELVAARRTFPKLTALLPTAPKRGAVWLRCAPADETRTRGPLNGHLRSLRAHLDGRALRVLPDPALPRGAWRFESAPTVVPADDPTQRR